MSARIDHVLGPALLAFAASACEPAAPSAPTWAADVAPILRANCVHCHASPQIHDAPDGFVLDRPDGFVTDDGRFLLGGRNMAYYVALRTADRSMPPRSPLTDRQIEVLQNFVALPAEDPDALPGSYGPVLGDPLADNHAPTMALVDDALDEQGRLVAGYRIDDADGDLVTGRLEARGPSGPPIVITRELASGRGEVRWDAAAAPAAEHELVAVLDDGSGEVELAVGAHAVEHAELAPTVTVSFHPEGLVTDADRLTAEPPAGTITLAGDAGDRFQLSVSAVRGDEVIPLAERTEVGAGEYTLAWPDDVPAGNNWRLRARVSVGAYVRYASSQPFTVSHEAATDLTWSDVKDTFAEYCTQCHRGSGSTLHLPWDFQTFDPLAQGVGDPVARGRIFRRVALAGNMPPISAELGPEGRPPLPAADRARLREWLLAGAPCGEPGVDGCPAAATAR